MAEVVRVAALTGYLEVMERFGIPAKPLLREQGLDADLLRNPEQLISAVAAIRLLERSAEITGCRSLGLQMAEGRALAHLGAASLLIAHQPTLRMALRTVAEFRSRINSTLILQMEEGAELTILGEHFGLKRAEPHQQASELVLGVLFRLCAELLGDQWRPLEVQLATEAPELSEAPRYSRLFRCRPLFGSERNAIVIASDDLDRPNPKGDERLALHAQGLLHSVLQPGRLAASDEIDRLIRLLLPSGRATIQTCAAMMGMTTRTLQRSLDDEGTSFSELLSSARMQLATDYLRNPRMRVTDIALLLGYSSIGAFTRWHTQSFGRPPRRRRSGSADELATA